MIAALDHALKESRALPVRFRRFGVELATELPSGHRPPSIHETPILLSIETRPTRNAHRSSELVPVV